MKFATIVLLGVLLLASLPAMLADEKGGGPAGAGEVVLSFTNGGASTDSVCIFFPLLLGDLKLGSLFAPSDAPVVDKEHAHLIWVSDYTGEQVASFDGSAFTLFLIPTGTGTIYFKENPGERIWTNMDDRSSWGEPVARFVRKAGIFKSLDGGNSGTMVNTAELVSSKSFKLNGKMFNFKDLIPHGMTCFETGSGSEENGTCIAVGGGL
jgi:hypothetical protein